MEHIILNPSWDAFFEISMANGEGSRDWYGRVCGAQTDKNAF